MKFRNYCLIVMGNTKDVISEIKKTSETEPNILDAKGILIATFSSVSTPAELTEWFRLNQRSFMLFDLDTDNSGVHISKKEIHEGLFGFLKTTNLEDKTSELLRQIKLTSDTQTNRTKTKNNSKTHKKITTEDVEKMSKREKEELWNSIVDNGVKNMTDDDKKLLELLSK